MPETGGLDVILFGFVFLGIGVLCRQFVAGRGISLPAHVFMIVAGSVIGFIALVASHELDPMHLKDIDPNTPFNIYMCILMFDCAFNTEIQYLRIISYHMAIIGIPTIVLTYVSICAAALWLFPSSLTIPDYIVVMSVIMTPGPHMMKAYLAPTNIQHDLKTLLEAEAMFGNYVAFLTFTLILTGQTFYAAIPFVFLDLVVGIVVGFLIGKLVVYWISNIFKDYVTQMTIILAMIYSGFAISYLMGSHGFICVVTMGLVISHRRSSMSTQFVQILNAFLELLVFCLTSLTSVSVGVYFVQLVIQNITITDLAITMGIFLIQNITRALVLLFTFKFAKKHLQTRSNAAIVWACNIRGSYSITMAYALLGSGFSTGNISKPFIVVILQILLSFVANSVICSYVIGYLNEDILSKKKWMIERAARLMINIRKSAVDSLRNAASIADADWNVVVRQTKLKADFMTAYRYASWLNKRVQDKADNGLNDDPIIDVRNEAIRQINLSEKAGYTRLYSEGMVSRESVRRLMYLITQCLKMKRMLIPHDIFTTNDKTTFLTRLEDELAFTIQQGAPQICIRVFLLAICFLDCYTIVLAMLFVLFDNTLSNKINFITTQNVAMFLGYCVIVLFVIIKNKSFHSKNMWQSMYKLVLVVTFFDLLLTASPIMLQLYLLKFVVHMADKELFTEYDMATAYKRVITETLRKMNSIITDRILAAEMKYVCHKNKLETAQYLSLSQLQHPNVMAALKTKTAMRLSLNAAEHALSEIREMGVLGEMDADIVHKEILIKMMAAQNFPYTIRPSTVRTVLQGIPWIEGDSDVITKLEHAGNFIKFYANDVIVTQGYLPGGIFIILHGVVRSESVRRHDHRQWKEDKVPYFCNSNQQSSQSTENWASRVELHSFYIRGNIIGELAFLNERPGHKTFRCVTYVETFFVANVDLSNIVLRNTYKREILSPIELKIWKVVAIRQATEIIHNSSSSTHLSRMTIINRMSDAVVVDGNSTRILTVLPNEVSAVILIHGYVSQIYSELRYVGPCILPYNQQKFISHPELGPRVIYLIVKSSNMEENPLDGLVPEDPHMTNYEDSLTISSGSSDVEPYRRDKSDMLELEDESDFMERMFTSGMSQSQILKVENYRIRESFAVVTTTT